MPNLRIPLVAPHSYLLRLRTQPGAAEAGQTGFRASAEPGFSVRVSLEFAGEYTLEPGAERDAPMAGPEAFDLMVAPPFSFWLHTLVYGKGLCAGTLNANGANLSRDPLVLSYAGSTSPMELMVRSDCAKLHLSLPLTAASFVPGIEPVYTVYVVPEFDTTVDVHPQTLRPSSGGSLMIEGFTPGDYRVYTFTSPVDLEYRNPTAMAQLGTAGQVVQRSLLWEPRILSWRSPAIDAANRFHNWQLAPLELADSAAGGGSSHAPGRCRSLKSRRGSRGTLPDRRQGCECGHEGAGAASHGIRPF